MTSHNATVLLSRLLSLKENSPFLLSLDSLSQSSHFLLEEFAHHCTNKILYLSYETLNTPSYASDFLDCCGKDLEEITKFVQVNEFVQNSSPLNKALIIVDSLNYIAVDKLTNFVSSIISPGVVVLGIYHTDLPQPQNSLINYPSPISLLTYIANSVFEVEAIHEEKIDQETLDEKLNKLEFPINSNLNSSTFKLSLTARRKSGRALIYNFLIDGINHKFQLFKKVTQDSIPEDESMLKDLTTFNLTTNTKQKLAREQVELPFMQAQEALGSSGGAIVYEFEKDDDYDEEDPYEDPF